MPTSHYPPRGIARIDLEVCDLEAVSAFYRDLLGMTGFEPGLLGYAAAGCCLSLTAGVVTPHLASSESLYWKIGITLRDLDQAVAFLRKRGWPVSEPRQFRDIGYMSHLKDPEGFSIELLQQRFEGQAQPAGSGHPIGGQATLAHLTVRTVDLAATQRLCEHALGMRLLSRQPVSERGFTLYFYAWSEELLPTPDLEAVENRSWLWARPYGLLEVQHLEQAESLVLPDSRSAGFRGFAFSEVGKETFRQVSLAELSPLADATSASA